MAVSDAPPLEMSTEQKDREIQSLVERVRAGDLTAFDQILRLHERRILGTAIQMGLSPADAQDVCQEVFLRVFRYLAGFRSDRNFEVWLWRIAVNVVYDTLRRRRDRGEVAWDAVLEEGVAGGGWGSGLQVEVENSDLCAKLLTRMGILTKQERMVFVLKELQELETAEVGKALKISAVTVRRHLGSARRKLREVLERMGRSLVD